MAGGGVGSPLPMKRRRRPASEATVVYPVPPPPGSRLWPVAAAATALVVLAAGIGAAVTHPWTNCGPGVERTSSGECVGVTDGGYVYAPELAGVERAIEKEDGQVLESGQPYVSIAYLGAMTPGDEPGSTIRRQLEGAYVAQLAANDGNFIASKPLVRMLLANDGNGDRQWQPVLRRLRDLIRADHLVAVVGLGLPSATTTAEIAMLHQAGIPIVGTSQPGGALVDEGLVSISPTDSAGVDAAIDYESGGHDPAARGRAAVVVEDTSRGDPYAAQGARFAQLWQERHLDERRTLMYQSNLPGADAAFASLVHDPVLCLPQLPKDVAATPAALPPLIYFAGPGHDLILFARALSAGCLVPNAGPYQVITGPDASNVPDDSANGLVTITYTGRVPPAPSRGPAPPLRAFYAKQFAKQFRGDSSDDEQAVQAHDAVWVAINTIRRAASTSAPVPDPGAVQQLLGQVQGNEAVTGIGGSIELDPGGGRVNEVVPVVQIRFDGASTKRSVTWEWQA